MLNDRDEGDEKRP